MDSNHHLRIKDPTRYRCAIASRVLHNELHCGVVVGRHAMFQSMAKFELVHTNSTLSHRP